MHLAHKIAGMIRSCREARGYSQEYMAEMLGINQSSYAHIESGKTALSLDRLDKISTILNVDIHDLIESGLEDEETSVEMNPGTISSGTRKVYDQLIHELKSEIDFLRSLVKER